MERYSSQFSPNFQSFDGINSWSHNCSCVIRSLYDVDAIFFNQNANLVRHASNCRSWSNLCCQTVETLLTVAKFQGWEGSKLRRLSRLVAAHSGLRGLVIDLECKLVARMCLLGCTIFDYPVLLNPDLLMNRRCWGVWRGG